MSEPAKPDAKPAEKKDAGHGGDHGHGHGLDAWGRLWVTLLALTLGGIAISIFLSSISDGFQQMFSRKAAVEFGLWFWKEQVIIPLASLVILVLVGRWFMSKDK